MPFGALWRHDSRGHPTTCRRNGSPAPLRDAASVPPNFSRTPAKLHPADIGPATSFITRRVVRIVCPDLFDTASFTSPTPIRVFRNALPLHPCIATNPRHYHPPGGDPTPAGVSRCLVRPTPLAGVRRDLMSKKASSSARSRTGGPDLFAKLENRGRRLLFLPRFLAEETDAAFLRGKEQDRAHEILRKWADMEAKGHLDVKETAIDANFLQEVFGEALGYKSKTQSPDDYQLERNFTVPGVGTADGALGKFSPGATAPPVAVIERKGARAHCRAVAVGPSIHEHELVRDQ
jgi:hypothetical protein